MKSGVHQLRLFIPFFVGVSYIQTVVGNGISAIKRIGGASFGSPRDFHVIFLLDEEVFRIQSSKSQG